MSYGRLINQSFTAPIVTFTGRCSDHTYRIGSGRELYRTFGNFEPLLLSTVLSPRSAACSTGNDIQGCRATLLSVYIRWHTNEKNPPHQFNCMVSFLNSRNAHSAAPSTLYVLTRFLASASSQTKRRASPCENNSSRVACETIRHRSGQADAASIRRPALRAADRNRRSGVRDHRTAADIRNTRATIRPKLLSC